MRMLLAVFFMLLLTGQAMGHWVELAAFRINQAWIAKNTCENRFRPQLRCNGQCVLMKKMKQQEKEDEKEPSQLKLESNSVIISSRTFFGILPALNTVVPLPYFPAVNTGTPVDISYSFFHPPRQDVFSFRSV
ncbi:MAG: hypothetical protein U0U70_06255 [Chitinophagaceae bacterium]